MSLMNSSQHLSLLTLTNEATLVSSRDQSGFRCHFPRFITQQSLQGQHVSGTEGDERLRGRGETGGNLSSFRDGGSAGGNQRSGPLIPEIPPELVPEEPPAEHDHARARAPARAPSCCGSAQVPAWISSGCWVPEEDSA